MRNAIGVSILRVAIVSIVTSAAVVVPETKAMSNPPRLFAIFSPEQVPAAYAASGYRAFRGVLPGLIIKGAVQSITLTRAGKLTIEVAPNDQVEFIPKDRAGEPSESHILLAPGGTISPELIAKP
jgi:hypothetical protein